MTSIFSSSWLCRLCGREACGECFAQVNELTADRPGAGQAEIAALEARREKHAHSNPFFLSCTRRNEHQAKDFSPMSRFCKEELEVAIDAMERLLIEVDNEHRRGTLNEISSSKEDGVTVQNGSSNNHENQTRSPSDQNLSAALGHLSQSIPSASYTPSSQSAAMHTPQPPKYPREPSPHTNTPPLPTQSLPMQTRAIHLNGGAALPTQSSAPSSSSQPQPLTHNAKDTQSSPQHFSPSLAPRGLASPPYIPPNLPESIASIPYHEIRRYSDSELSSVGATNKFARIWALGEPLLVTDVLSKFKIQWTPEYFNEKHGDQNCLILECQTDVNKRVTVGEFFRLFGRYENRTECWKLKVRALELIAFSRSYIFLLGLASINRFQVYFS